MDSKLTQIDEPPRTTAEANTELLYNPTARDTWEAGTTCSACNNLSLLFSDVTRPERPLRISKTALRHYDTVEDLDESSRTCGLCDLLSALVQKDIDPHFVTEIMMEEEHLQSLDELVEEGRGYLQSFEKFREEGKVVVQKRCDDLQSLKVIMMGDLMEEKNLQPLKKLVEEGGKYLDSLEKHIEEENKDLQFRKKTIREVEGKYPILKDRQMMSVIVEECYGSGKLVSEFRISLQKGSSRVTDNVLRVYSNPNDATASKVQGRPVAKTGGDPRAIQLAQSWIEDCYNNHPECRWSEDDNEFTEIDPLLPSRVIDIGESDEEVPKLVCPNGQRGKWAALSHRWPGDGDKVLRLLTKTITDLRSAIPRKTVPPTFEDAFIVTRALGLRYIWIDSLCIIQDSPLDWAEQSSRMPEIYQNAFVTIAAAATEDCLGGMLGERDWVPESAPHELIVTNKTGQGSLFIDFCIDQDHKIDARTKRNDVNYLAYRAWCFQESLLSHRLLTFDRLQMSYTCLRHGLTEGREITTAVAKEYKNEFLPAFRGPSLIDDERLQSALRSWYRVLADYTNRNLTFPSDKLVAISGIARVVGRFLNDEYFAGLWRKSLPQSLLWSPYDEEDLPNPGYVATRTSTYRAPSWSWASVHSRITNFLCRAQPLEPIYANVLRISTELSGPDAYGQVKSGRLIIRGPFIKAFCGYNIPIWPGQPRLSPCFNVDGVWDGDPYDISHCIFDDESPKPGSELWCLRITRSYGLIVKPKTRDANAVTEYERIGIFHLRLVDVDNSTVPDRFSDKDISTIIIV